jgi:hypothetical protein
MQAGGSYGIFRVIDAILSPLPDPSFAQLNTPHAMTTADPAHLAVQTNLTHGSVFAGVFEMALRSRLLRTVTFAMFAWGMISFCIGLSHGSSPTLSSAFAAILRVALFAMLPVSFALAVSALSACLAAIQPGVLGGHRFETRDEGLFEATAANQTVTSWSCVREMATLTDKVVIRLTGLRFHIIPRSAFISPQHESAFVSALMQRLGRGVMN